MSQLPYAPTVMPENDPGPLSASALDDYYESIFPGWKAAHNPQQHPPTWEENEAEEEYEGQYGESQWQSQPEPEPAQIAAPPTPPAPSILHGAPPIVAPFVSGGSDNFTSNGQATEQSPAMANEFGHTFLRTDGNADVYYLIDEAGAPIYWAVKKGGDSRTVIDGSMTRVEPQRLLTGANQPAAHSSGAYVDPSHQWVGYDPAGNDVYSLTDSDGAVLQWSVRRGDDSRAMLEGTLRNISAGQRTAATTTGPSPIINLAAILTGNLIRNPPTAAATTPSSSAPSNTTRRNTTPAATTPTLNTSSRFDPSHVFVGYDSRGNDVYQLIDEAGTVVEWAVKHGDDSRAVIAGTIRNIGNGSTTQVVSTNRTTIPGATTTPATATTIGSGIAETIGSSLPQIITAGLIAVLTR